VYQLLLRQLEDARIRAKAFYHDLVILIFIY